MRRLAVIVAASLFDVGLWAEVRCGEERPLKPVRCICGTIIDQSGVPFAGVTVKAIQNGREVETVRTAGDGKFRFADLRAGVYVVTAEAQGFRPFRREIKLSKPSPKFRRGLTVTLVTFYPDNCGSVAVIEKD